MEQLAMYGHPLIERDFVVEPAEPDWDSLDTLKYSDETKLIAALLENDPLARNRTAVLDSTREIVTAGRSCGRRDALVGRFLQELSLSTQDGLALMGLADGLLRTPDMATNDRLTAEKKVLWPTGPRMWTGRIMSMSAAL